MPSVSHGATGHTVASAPFGDLVQSCHATTEALAEVLKAFWGLSVKVVFFGVSEQTHYYWRMDDFHVSQLALEASSNAGQVGARADMQTPMAWLRVSDSACDVLLGRVLGQLATPFSFKSLSPLEGTILNEFSRDVLGCLKKNLIKKSAKVTNAPPLHLIWLLQPEPSATNANQPVLADLPVGKLIFTVPPSVLRYSSGLRYHALTDSVPDSFFYHVQTALPIYLGCTKVQLADLEQLEPEDLIVLDSSRVGRMYLLDAVTGQEVSFQADIQHQHRITIPYTQEFASMEAQSQQSAKQSLWDNLMIEVDASFEPIKLPLKQLKQMSEGLVIEMGDLVHNRIALQVEGKTLAWGELLIVGDKYAVRINQVAANPGEEAVEPNLYGAAPVMMPPGGVPPMLPGHSGGIPPVAEEAANLDNYLDKDFDEIAEDDEDW